MSEWLDKDGKVALFRYVYHAGDLETASHPARYAQRHPRLVALHSPPRYPLKVLASDGRQYYAEAADRGRINDAGVFRLSDTAPRGRTPR